MDLPSSTAVKIILATFVCLALAGGWRYFPKRKIFLMFCLIIVSAAGITYSLQQKTAPPPISDEQKAAALLEQQHFIVWYTEYKKNIDIIHNHWQQYHQILHDFKADSISLQTAYSRIKHLQDSSNQLKAALSQLEPPAALSDANYELTATIIKKTRAYVDRQYEVITNTRDAADPGKQTSTSQPDQARQLERIMIMDSPVNLNISDEISQLKAAMTLPEED